MDLGPLIRGLVYGKPLIDQIKARIGYYAAREDLVADNSVAA